MHYSLLLIFALLLGVQAVPHIKKPVHSSTRQCKAPFFSVHGDQVLACWKKNPGKVDVNVTFTDASTVTLSSKGKTLVDGCYSFEVPVGHGYPAAVQVSGFDCTFDENKKAGKNCGWDLCDYSAPAVAKHAFTCPAVVDEGVILKALYDALGGASWTNSQGWDNQSPACNGRFGVTCDNNNRVNYIDLRNNNLYGTHIPQEVGCLHFLKGFHLDNNYVKGEIPESFCFLTNIIYLTLPNNVLTGSIPTCFSSLVNLQHLYLQHNQLSGVLPDFSNYHGIKELHVEFNCFSGSIPQSISTHSIIDLDFRSNSFSGCIPDIFKGLEIYYADNQFCDGPVPCWFDLAANGCSTLVNRHQVTDGSICGQVNQCVSVIG